MEANQEKLNQMSVINQLSTIPERQRRWLIGFWAFSFRLFVYPLINPALFDCLFSKEPSGPATDPQVTASLILIQDMLNKTDEEMYYWMMSEDIGVRFATDTLDIDPESISAYENGLTDFRNRCRSYAETHDGKNPLDECLAGAKFGICALIGTNLSKVQMAPTQIAANMAEMSRERIIYTGNRRMLEYIAKQAKPEQLKAIEEEELEHYLEDFDINKVLYRVSVSQDKKRKKLANEADMILHICTEEDLESMEGKMFTRILSEQTVADNEIRRFAVPEEHFMPAGCVQNPADPDVTSREKAFVGYITRFAEAVSNTGSQVVSWDLQKNTVKDPGMAKTFLTQAEAIIMGIDSYNKMLGIENPADMEECRAVLKDRMKLVGDTLDAARKSRRIPRAADVDPLHKETGKGVQVSMFDLYDGL